MLVPAAPIVLQKWIANPPNWIEIKTVTVIDKNLSILDSGEQAAITLSQTLPADLLIIDERLGRRAASSLGIPIIGTLGILDDAANRGLINLSDAIDRLKQTNFRISRRIIQTLLES